MEQETSEPQSVISDIDWPGLIRRRKFLILGIWAAIVVGAVAFVKSMAPVYQAQTLMVIEKERGAGDTATSNSATNIEIKAGDYYHTQYVLLKARTLMEKVQQELKLENHPVYGGPGGVAVLSRMVTIFPIAQSRLLYVKVESADPKLAADVANTLSRVYVEQNLSSQLFISKDILRALQANPNLASTQRLYQALPAVVGDGLISTFKGEYAVLENRRAVLSAKVTAKHPSMIALESNMATIERQIKARTRNVVAVLKEQLRGQLRGNNVRIVDSALVPKYPVRPKKKLLCLLSVIVGLIFGFLVGLAVDLLDQSVRTENDVVTKLKMPYLGSIPFARQKGIRTVYEPLLESKPSLTGESFRNLRTMVDFAGVGGKADGFLVTSTIQEEGKTYIASNLAVCFAQMGEKVLLVDGDLRRPKLDNIFRLSSERGLSDFLAAGKDASEIAGYLQDGPIPGLKILVCGTRPPNPSELLNTPRVPALIAWAKSNFDRVIVDCAPMFPINDTLLWARHIRAVLFVTRFAATRIGLIQNANQKMISNDIKILGIAVNAAKASSLTYSQYGYYYHHYYQSEPAGRGRETTKSS